MHDHLAVALADELGGLAGVAGLQLTGGHDDGADVQLLEGQVALEGLALALATPDAWACAVCKPSVQFDERTP